MRDIRHENVNMFIGACTEPENILIVTQYASKGSLQVLRYIFLQVLLKENTFLPLGTYLHQQLLMLEPSFVLIVLKHCFSVTENFFKTHSYTKTIFNDFYNL